MRGYRIATELLEDCAAAGVEILTDTVVFSIQDCTQAWPTGTIVFTLRPYYFGNRSQENPWLFRVPLARRDGAGAAQTLSIFTVFCRRVLRWVGAMWALLSPTNYFKPELKLSVWWRRYSLKRLPGARS